MRFEEKLKKLRSSEIWNEYCGFLDLSVDEYMNMQNRLMLEQIDLWSKSGLGRGFLNGETPKSIDEFREIVPLTDYIDYSDMLLQKRADILPDTPIVWIQTTWEGGHNPIKVAPYTQGMLNAYRNNVMACFLLGTSTEKGSFDVSPKDKILYALAPLPFATGLFPLALGEEIGIEFLPSVRDAERMSFSERNKAGFKAGMKKGIQFFFGLGSVAYYVSLSVSALSGKSGGLKALSSMNIGRALKLLRAKYRCKKEGRELLPKDLFDLKGFMVAGTDNRCYKDDLERLWGVRPMELFAGTEPSCIGTETWTRNGMYFFPDACFYEFIPEADMLRSLYDKSYNPKTYLMDEVIPGEKYELVVSVLKGGAFMRYRVGDVYRCVGVSSADEDIHIPRFEYVDRIPTVIDIAGFTRITENSIKSVIDLSGLPVENWVAVKEYNSDNRPYLHMYIEMAEESLSTHAITIEVLKEHLSVYFRYVDSDYKDLKHILGMDPLEITILRCGTFDSYERDYGSLPHHINPSWREISSLMIVNKKDYELFGDRRRNNG